MKKKEVKSRLSAGALNHKKEAKHSLNEGAANINSINVMNPDRYERTLRAKYWVNPKENEYRDINKKSIKTLQSQLKVARIQEAEEKLR